MELLIIQYSLATVLWVFAVTLPFRIVLMVRDAPYTLLNKLKTKKWKKLF